MSKSDAPDRDNIFSAISTTLVYFFLILFGRLRDLFGRLTSLSRYYNDITGIIPNDSLPDSTPLVYVQDTFFTRRIFHRIRDCWDRPIASPPGSHIDVVIRSTVDGNKSLFVDKEKDVKERMRFGCLNLGSYNYLGFADDWKVTCGKEVMEALREFGPSMCSSQSESGKTVLLDELEKYVAKFVYQEDAVVFSMGYGTNTSVLSLLTDENSLIVSDSLNHSSIINGCRGSRNTKIVPFKHNDIKMLENVLQRAICFGQTHDFRCEDLSKCVKASEKGFKPFNKILIVVEGIYSMEGETCNISEVLRLAKQYKAYVYVDEAHSIGALGKTGRGVLEHHADPENPLQNFKDIDVMMGTFSKSFAGMGGYVAGKQEIIDFIRKESFGVNDMCALSPTVTKQILTAFKYITGEKLLNGKNIGEEKLRRIKENARFFRNGLKKLGCQILGDDDSPVIPLMVFQPSKIAAFSRECLNRDMAVVVVGFPAVPAHENRVRFCISAGHEKEDLKQALKEIGKVCRLLNVRYQRSMFG